MKGVIMAVSLSTAFGLPTIGFSAIGSAQEKIIPASETTIFEDITLSPAFTPNPATVRGISGGAVAASELMGRSETATGPCTGFIDAQPDHRITLTQFFNQLSIEIQSTDDTSLVIRGPGGTWCNDDFSYKNPGITGQWLSGTYEVWVGSPRQDAYFPYVIRLTEPASP